MDSFEGNIKDNGERRPPQLSGQDAAAGAGWASTMYIVFCDVTYKTDASNPSRETLRDDLYFPFQRSSEGV